MIQVGELKSGSIAAYSKNVQKVSFQAYMSRIVQERIEDERRKKAGGGGGSMSYDKIKTSMMYANFLSNKTIQAMLRNFNGLSMRNDLLVLGNNNVIFSKSFILPEPILKIFSFMSSIMPVANAIKNFNLDVGKSIVKGVNNLAISLSAQINKLKDMLENEIKEKMRWKNFKNALTRTKEILDDFIEEIKSKAQDLFLFFKKGILTNI